MIKTAVISCALLAFFSAIIKLIIASSKNAQIGKAITAINGTVLILVFMQAIFTNEYNGFSLTQIPEDYEIIANEAFEKSIDEAKKDLEKKICKSLKEKFNFEDVNCELLIENSTLNVIEAKIMLNSSKFTVSTYEIKVFIKNQFQIDAEVYFI